jgi:hypothetical protein
MTSLPLCERCGQWRPRPADFFCSFCGHRLINIRAALSQSDYTLDQLMPPTARLTIENPPGPSSISVLDVESSASWIRVDWGRQQKPYVLAPGARLNLNCRVLPSELSRDSYHQGTLLIRSTAGEDLLKIQVTPALELSFSAFNGNSWQEDCAFDVVLDGRSLEKSLLRVRVLKGVATLTDLSTDTPKYVKIAPSSGEGLERVLDARNPQRSLVELKLDVDERQLLDERTLCPSERTVRVNLHFGDRIYTQVVTLRLWNPPQLQIPDEHDYSLEAVTGQRNTLTLTLSNRNPFAPGTDQGNSPLVLTAVEIQVRRLDAAGQVSTARTSNFLRPDPKWIFPTRIPGGTSARLDFHFDTLNAPDDDTALLGIGTYAVVLELIANYETVSRKVFKEIRVAPLPPFPGVLAIDFGTSNSCVAFFRDTDRRRGLLAVHGETTTPTLLQYLRPPEDNTPATVRIGREVITNVYLPRNIRSIVRSPKLRLGEPGERGTFEVAYYETDDIRRISARQAVADFVRSLRKIVVEELRARPARLVFTHPSDFEPKQIQELKDALVEVFGTDCFMEALPEPVAAALTHVLSDELLGRDHYTLAVFDFGGGTTDLSLLEVENRRIGDRIEICPRQTQFSGHLFGGENLTNFIEEWAWNRCQEFVKASGQGAFLTRDFGLRDPVRRVLALVNRYRLFEWAERIKLGLVEHGTEFFERYPGVSETDFPHLALQLLLPDGTEAVQGFLGREIAPTSDEFFKWLENQLQRLGNDLAQLTMQQKLAHPDYILLSGKSSNIPMVREVLAALFPESVLQLAAEPKQCVVEGACVPYVLSFGGDLLLMLDGDLGAGFVRTTRRIGYERITGGLRSKFEPIFDRNVPIPERGLTAQRNGYLLRPGMQLRILQNASTISDSLENNPNIKDLGVYVPLPGKVPTKPVSADLHFHLSTAFELTIIARLPDGGEIPFVRRETALSGG